MKHFKNGELTNWKPVEAGTILEFATYKPKNVKFQVLSNSCIEIWVSHSNDMKGAVLQAVADDKVSVEFVTVKDCYVQIKAEKKAAVFVNIRDVDQNVVAVGESFTNIEPRVRDNSEFARMMHWVKLNEQRREAAMRLEREELAHLKAELKQQAAQEQKEVELKVVDEDAGAEAETEE
jgi:hypothetical protein